MEISTLEFEPTAEPLVESPLLADALSLPDTSYVDEMERLGDAIAELSAHLEAATARLLDLIREFDARGGWNGGFRSCAHWLSWRVGLDLHLDANTARPTWSGERLDVGYAIGVLHPRALVPRSEAVPAPRGDRER